MTILRQQTNLDGGKISPHRLVLQGRKIGEEEVFRFQHLGMRQWLLLQRRGDGRPRFRPQKARQQTPSHEETFTDAEMKNKCVVGMKKCVKQRGPRRNGGGKWFGWSEP